jgi:hypothetical protein
MGGEPGGAAYISTKIMAHDKKYPPSCGFSQSAALRNHWRQAAFHRTLANKRP